MAARSHRLLSTYIRHTQRFPLLPSSKPNLNPNFTFSSWEDRWIADDILVHYTFNALVEFLRVVEAKEQVVVGTLHHLTIKAIDAGKKKIYEAKVWVKPWLGFSTGAYKCSLSCNSPTG